MISLSASRRWLAGNWFYPAFGLVFALVWLLTRSAAFMTDGGEAAILFDLCVTVPALYVLCYRKVLPAGQMAIRVGAIACLGVWIAARFVPPESQSVLPHLSWARLLGMAVLALIELRLLVAMVRLTFSRSATAEEISVRTGAPLMLARLMVLEAAFWRAVWTFVRRR